MREYHQSESYLERALSVIPLGSQTFSKSKTQYPLGVSPFFIREGKGCRVRDVDGNEYIDFVSGLASINLGYRDEDVDRAVHKQMEQGVIFSLPHPIETEVAEEIVKLVPCADMVRFGKNGSDATAGAIRVARAKTGRDRVAVCGYHGWQDWYIGSTARSKGVPKAVRELTHGFQYNQIDSLHSLFKQYPGEFAAVILEPMNVVEPQNGFLQEVGEITRRHGAALVFDETITGFRFALGGAQEHFGVTPDLATFGKGMANGYPVSAVAGKADWMREMEEIFFSFTFGGEALSLAAALATMKKLQRESVIPTLWKRGKVLMDGCKEIIRRHQIDFVSIDGSPTWSFIGFKDIKDATSFQIKTLFMQEVFSRGILTIGSHNMSFSHGDGEIKRLLEVYDEVLPWIQTKIENREVLKSLRCKPIEPLFRIR